MAYSPFSLELIWRSPQAVRTRAGVKLESVFRIRAAVTRESSNRENIRSSPEFTFSLSGLQLLLRGGTGFSWSASMIAAEQDIVFPGKN